ncbi:NUDIX domain-containing protein [Sinomonas atrocyanea]|jgi:predicted NUDIX family NTP pyrophosphohydrolase|uniref:NUDIX domain-containing protein n=1 Tax=Sinomonas atrocyanea TaxID=37927 RepID=UPI002783833C|nr:NUDIX domain-containing protein [Sinomonas atrocyanea]MDQ0261633.1 putative NUDIX family NTP pyrophosphohydrolase [Sinomonas atrocyanea]MDR6621508.1 putative NUDIX family NTP pyrophosphohydrolase [Sinomonas atrocyanea]
MPMKSAGILLYRRPAGYPDGLEVWIAHMGGPFWARKDEHGWSLPKGLCEGGEDPLAAARREFAEEMGSPPPAADYVHLGEFRQPSGKVITAFAAEAEFEPAEVVSNTFALEWPKGSGRVQEYPEVDRAEWVSERTARLKLVKGQIPILDALLARLG